MRHYAQRATVTVLSTAERATSIHRLDWLLLVERLSGVVLMPFLVQRIDSNCISISSPLILVACVSVSIKPRVCVDRWTKQEGASVNH